MHRYGSRGNIIVESDFMRRLPVLCMVIMMLSRCVEKREVKRAAFAWEGVETGDEKLLYKYQMQ